MEVEAEEKIVMMMSRSSSCPTTTAATTTWDHQRKKISSPPPHHDHKPITSSSSSKWKLYHNPFYNKPHHHSRGNNTRFPRRPHNPLPSARKIAASFWDLALFRPAALSMENEVHAVGDVSVAMEELRAELERERRARRKLEHMNKRLSKELAEERRGREAVEKVCEELAKEISCDKASIERMRKEIEEERKMLRMAEVLREERVQMKLAEAKIYLEEKMSALGEPETEAEAEADNCTNADDVKIAVDIEAALVATDMATSNVSFPEKPMARLVLGEKTLSSTEDNVANTTGSECNNILKAVPVTAVHRRLPPSPEPENPHIKRGIKGFVEFPRMVRAIGSKSRNWGAKKIECQKAQIRILLKQKSPIRSITSNNNDNSFIWT